MKIQYITTDLVLAANESIITLAEALTRNRLVTLDCNNYPQDGKPNWHACLHPHENYSTPEETIKVMLDAIELLDCDSLSLWWRCKQREFNLGYSSGDTPNSLTNELSHSTLDRIVKSGVSLGITLYPPDPDD